MPEQKFQIDERVLLLLLFKLTGKRMYGVITGYDEDREIYWVLPEGSNEDYSCFEWDLEKAK